MKGVIEEATYQRRLAEHRPNQQPADAVVEPQWKTVAGFSKISLAGA
jgi:hypothetical protein